MVKGEDLQLEVVGLNTRRNVIKMEIKVSKWGTPCIEMWKT